MYLMLSSLIDVLCILILEREREREKDKEIKVLSGKGNAVLKSNHYVNGTE